MSPASLPAAAAAAPPLESDDLLPEILLRLPPQPSSLPRARAVSRRWRSLASAPGFCARFRSHHRRRRNPPLLGCFLEGKRRIHFNPALEAPNRVPEGRFQAPETPVAPCDRFNILGCRHGLLLLINGWRGQLLVWDPVSGDQRRLDKPPVFHKVSGAVLRVPVSAARDGDGDAGDHFHFQVVLVGSCDGQQHAPAGIIASVYSSNTGAWGNLISTPAPASMAVYPDKRSVMVGNSLYWLFLGKSQGFIEFDLDSCSLALTPLPGKTATTCATLHTEICVIPAAQGLGFLFLSGFSAQLWKRKTNCDGVASWELSRTIALDKLLSVNSDKDMERLCIIGLAEDNNMVLVQTSIGIFTLHLESLESKKIFEPNHPYPGFCPFEGVYTAEKGIDGGQDGPELVQNVQNDLSTWTRCRDILIEKVSRVGFWWLRCINGLFGIRR